MQSVINAELKSVIIAKKAERYCSFPDVCVMADGRLLTVWREADKHVATESRLMLKIGSPGGDEWSEERILNAGYGHMPRISVTPDGAVYIIDDGAPPNTAQGDSVESTLFVSRDNGGSFGSFTLDSGNGRGIPACPAFAPDKIIRLESGDFICAAQVRLGTSGKSYDYTFCNLIYRSKDEGKSWYADTVAACELSLKLCEVSVCVAPGGRLLALYRVNGTPPEETRYNFSSDGGLTWGELKKAPFFGQRPTAGFTSDGRLLVTYRKLNKPSGTAAWLGTIDELEVGGGRELEFASANGIGHGDMGYSGWVEYVCGRFLCVYHHREPDEKLSHVRGTFFTYDDFKVMGV